MTVFNEADLKYRYMFYKCFRRYSQVYVHVYNGFQYACFPRHTNYTRFTTTNIYVQKFAQDMQW